MRRTHWVSLITLAMLGPVGQEQKTDVERLQGTWKVVEVNGRPSSADGESIMVVEGERVRHKSVTMWVGTVEWDSKADPMTIDHIADSGPRKGQKTRRIFKFEGEEMLECASRQGADLPTEFASSSENRNTLWRWKRVKGNGKVKEAHDIEGRLQGTWELSSMTVMGTTLSPTSYQETRSFEGRKERCETRLDGGGSIRLVDPSADPKAMIRVVDDGPLKGKEIPGIYKFEGDTWTVCMGQDTRPTGFGSGNGRFLTVYKRVKP